MKPSYDCIVVANGSFPEKEELLNLLKNAPVIIACDGAIENLHKRGLTPTAIVGDLDSIPEEMLRLYADRIHIVVDQEINDLTKAVRFAHNRGYRKVLIMAATGLREDHTLGNISLLLDYAPLFEQIEMISDFGRFVPVLHTSTLPSLPGQQISLFSMNPNGEITTEGLRWPITRRRLTAWWQGSLNEALGTEFTLTLSSDARLIVYFLSPRHF